MAPDLDRTAHRGINWAGIVGTVACAPMAHEQRTAQLARELALIHGVDPNRAELAALVHDIADHYGDVELLLRARQCGLDISQRERDHPRLLHGPVGAAILEREYGLSDDELLDAVRQHVIGGPHMSSLAKVLFVADKLEPGRDPPGDDGSVYALARECLDCAVLKLQAQRIAALAVRGDEPWARREQKGVEMVPMAIGR